MACDPQFVNTRRFAVNVAEHVLSINSVVLWLFWVHEVSSRDASCAVVRF